MKPNCDDVQRSDELTFETCLSIPREGESFITHVGLYYIYIFLWEQYILLSSAFELHLDIYANHRCNRLEKRESLLQVIQLGGAMHHPNFVSQAQGSSLSLAHSLTLGRVRGVDPSCQQDLFTGIFFLNLFSISQGLNKEGESASCTIQDMQ